VCAGVVWSGTFPVSCVYLYGQGLLYVATQPAR
jgi:hypothetical protein